jgi:hypothetical protein
VDYVGLPASCTLNPYSMDSCLCLWYEHFLLLTSRTLVHAHSLHHFYFYSRNPYTSQCHKTFALHSKDAHPCSHLAPFFFFFVRTLGTFVCVCTTSPYRTPPSTLIPLVREIDISGSLLLMSS